jgi:hypothetical protein
MHEYIATMGNGEEFPVEARNIIEAVEEAIWQYSDRDFIVAVEFGDRWSGEYRLLSTIGPLTYTDEIYASKQDAIAHGTRGYDETMIAVPHLSR